MRFSELSQYIGITGNDKSRGQVKSFLTGDWKKGNCNSDEVFSLNAYAILLSECVI